MKHYKSFPKVWIGCSDGSFLTLTGCGDDGVKAEIIKFGGDNDYYAYVVKGRDVYIGEHYRLVASFNSWLSIFDDHDMSFFYSGNRGDELINIYRAGEYGIIIHLVDEVNEDGIIIHSVDEVNEDGSR